MEEYLVNKVKSKKIGNGENLTRGLNSAVKI